METTKKKEKRKEKKIHLQEKFSYFLKEIKH